MSLTQTVVAIVKERGAVTVDEIRLEGHTREQLAQALKNACKRGLIECDGIQGGGRGVGRLPGVYRPLGALVGFGASVRTTVQKVAAVVQQNGDMTLDDLEPLFPDLNREQLNKALSNGKARGLVQCIARGSGGPTARPSVWTAGHVRVGPASNRPRRPPNSPWEIGQELRVDGRWPPTSHEGRKYELLGGWTD